MKNAKNKADRWITEATGLGETLLSPLPELTLCGTGAVQILGMFRLALCSSGEMVIAGRSGAYRIRGRGLCLSALEREGMVLQGRVESICIERGEEE